MWTEVGSGLPGNRGVGMSCYCCNAHPGVFDTMYQVDCTCNMVLFLAHHYLNSNPFYLSLARILVTIRLCDLHN